MLFFCFVASPIFATNSTVMQKHIAILRGINVSGKNKIKMQDLVQALKSLGFENVQTYIQSGNVLFDSQEESMSILSNQIKDVLFNAFGCDVPVVVFTPEYLAKVVRENPFPENPEIPTTALHFTFLSEAPEKENLALVSEISNPPDENCAGDRVFYVYCPNGYGRTKFNNTFFEQKLKVTATTRNWRTCQKLLEMAARK
jgi:uncharacterized protein (DUF1697 family)